MYIRIAFSIELRLRVSRSLRSLANDKAIEKGVSVPAFKFAQYFNLKFKNILDLSFLFPHSGPSCVVEEACVCSPTMVKSMLLIQLSSAAAAQHVFSLLRDKDLHWKIIFNLLKKITEANTQLLMSCS